MESAFSTRSIKAYLQANWMKVVLLVLLCFVFLKKDLSFEFNLNSPLKVEEPANEEMIVPQSSDEGKRPKVITEKIEKKGAQKQTTKRKNASILDRFELPFLGRAKDKTPTYAEHGEIDERTIQAYLSRFGHVAISEQKKYGIPASIILANALFHSFAGQRDMVLSGNNHFAIPCGRAWDGDRGKYQGSCYRHYENAWSSFRDHSVYLNQGKFRSLAQLGATDYQAWAKGLEKAKYSEQRNLANHLIRLIEDYQLYAYDH
ncbi:MAG: glucosaminidase domain-containing protein [Bacteroidota bacterium]